jgi:hypothetical protein
MRRHNFDPISFILGALFAAVGLTFLFGDTNIGDLHIAVVWPIPLIVIGVLMLVTTIQRRNREVPVSASATTATEAAPTAAIRDERPGLDTEELELHDDQPGSWGEPRSPEERP